MEIARPRELFGKRLYGYSFGDFGIILTNIFINTFIFRFYVYTVNLDSVLVSVGIAAQGIAGALSAIFFGVITDNKKPGKLGKRRPFLLYGLPIWIFTSIIIWLPPWKAPQDNSIYWPTALFLWVVLLTKTIAGSSINTSFLSMLPEQSQTSRNRKKIASIRTFLMIVASIIALMLPLIVESILPEPGSSKWWEISGQLYLIYMPLIGIIFTILGVGTILVAFFAVDESFHRNNNKNNYRKKTVTETFRSMVVPAKDRNYFKYLLVGFFNGVSGKIFGLVIIPFLTYVLFFSGPDFYIYIIVSAVSKISWFYLWKYILRRSHLMRTYSLALACIAIASYLELIFLFTFIPNLVRVFLFIIILATILGAMYGFGLFRSPLISAMIDEAAEKNVSKQNFNEAVSDISGAYFGLNTFSMAMGQSISALLVGFILTGVNEENPIILTLLIASAGIFYTLSYISLKRIKLRKEI